jgi:glyoxylase-like metal-dependent hydrolase (beta-lactamase superfamily II)
MEPKIERGAAPDVHRIEDAGVNWYLVEADDGLTIVDAGVPRSWDSLHQVLGMIGRDAAEIRALVLTHAHFDHIGMAERVRRELGVPVLVHENDAPLARKPLQYTHERARSRYLLTKPAGLPHVLGFLAARAFWPPPIRETHGFSEGVLDVPGSPRVVFTPGHTVGHCALHFPDRDAAIVGDAIVMLDPYLGKKGPRIVAGAATADSAWALRSLDAIAGIEAGTVLTGHGEPWRGGTAEAVRLARQIGPS